MKPNSILILGCGGLGIRTGALLLRDGWQVAGVCRNPASLPLGFTGYTADYSQGGSLTFLSEAAPDFLLMTLKPSDNSAEGYQQGFPAAVRNMLAGLGSHRPKAVLMVSSTRVFAEQEGGWVDESSALATVGYAAGSIIEAEQLLQNSPQDNCIVRFGGIYGDPEGPLLAKVARGELCAAEPLRYTNRIHRDDCAGVLAHLLSLGVRERASVYVGVDDAPAPRYEVESWLAARLGIAVTPAGQTQGNGPQGHRRCGNRLMKESGYVLQYPDYREGYEAVLAARPPE